MYKLVENFRGKLYSCWVGGALKTEYIPNQWVSGHVGLNLMVFKTLEDLYNFYNGFAKADSSLYRLEAWKCSVINPKNYGYFMPDVQHYIAGRNCDKILSIIKNNNYTEYLPRGTVFCENVMLTEKMPSLYCEILKII